MTYTEHDGQSAPVGPRVEHVTTPTPRRPRHSQGLVVALSCLAVVSVALAALVAVLVVRSVGADTATTGASSSPLSYVESPQTVIAEVERRGGPACRPYEAIDDPIGARYRGRCYVGAKEITIGVYEDSAGADAQFEAKSQLMAVVGAKVYMAIGANWTLDGDDEGYVEQASQLLGARYRHT